MVLVVSLFCLMKISASEETTSITITLDPNIGDVIGAKVTMTNNTGNKSHVYKQKAKGTSVLFKNIVPGTYTLSVEHDDYFPYYRNDITVHNTILDFTAYIRKNGPSTIQVDTSVGSADGASVKITNKEGKTLQATLQGDSVTFQRLIPGGLTIEVTHEDYFTYTRQYILDLSLVHGISIYIGKKGPASGIVFYDKGIVSDGWRYLEAAPANTEFNADWNSAINICQELNINGITGWMLPNKEQLDLMYQNLHRKNLGGFDYDYYWSSSQYSNNLTWYQDFNDGIQGYYTKYINTYKVRAVRAF